MTQVLTIPTPTTPTQAIEFGIGAWIREKFGHSKNEKTRTTYGGAMPPFASCSSARVEWPRRRM